jgi:RNA polymerase sigma factor (sigma-70 family)
MASRSVGSDELRRQAAGLFGGGAVAGLGDGELLERFARRLASGEVEAAEAAFGALVARHGGMVLGVCRRALKDPHDAEDAFQAVFLVLARRAGSVRVDDSLGRWLYGVSRKVASRARKRSERLRSREVSSTSIDAPEPAHRGSAEAVAERSDLRAVILDELSRLPGRYREAIEACDLDGCTHEEAALRLGWPVGTVRSRLSRGRDQLRGRLERRGLGLPAIASPLAGRLADPVSPALATATAQLAVRFAMRRALDGSFPVAVTALTEGALRTMTIAKLTVAMPAALLVAGAAVATTQFPTNGGGAVPPDAPKAADSSGGGTGQTQGASAGLPPKANGGIAGSLPAGQGAVGGDPAGEPGPLGPTPFLLRGVVFSTDYMFRGAGQKIALKSGPLIVVASAPHQLTFYNALNGKSNIFEIPEGVVAEPLANPTIAVLAMHGKEIPRVAAFAAENEAISVLELEEPVSGAIIPVIGKGLAAFAVGKHVYAYSGPVDSWGVIERDEDTGTMPVVTGDSDSILCED